MNIQARIDTLNGKIAQNHSAWVALRNGEYGQLSLKELARRQDMILEDSRKCEAELSKLE